MSRLLVLALAVLAACASPPAASPTPVRADLVLVPGGHPDDPTLLVAEYREWDATGQRIPGIELDHGHGPEDEEPEEDEPVVQAWVGLEAIPIQAVDADGDRVFVDLDALPMGRQTLRIRVAHDGLLSEELVVSILDRRLASS